jgi:hypothetical protein
MSIMMFATDKVVQAGKSWVKDLDADPVIKWQLFSEGFNIVYD